MNYSFDILDTYCNDGLSESLIYEMANLEKAPVIVCIGSDRVTGDALSPIVGTLLKERYKVNAYIYGTLEKPINAINIDSSFKILSKIHLDRKFIIIDAGIGQEENIGKIRFKKEGIIAGSAVRKNEKKYGDFSILGIVNHGDIYNFSIKNPARLHFVYNMANIIAKSISNAFDFLFDNVFECESIYDENEKWLNSNYGIDFNEYETDRKSVS